MIRIELEEDKAIALKEILEVDLSDLRMEISHTDSQDYREMLKGRSRILDEVIHQLKSRSKAIPE